MLCMFTMREIQPEYINTRPYDLSQRKIRTSRRLAGKLWPKRRDPMETKKQEVRADAPTT